MSWVDFWSALEHDHWFWAKSTEDYFENFIATLKVEPSFEVLDFGAGPGYLSCLLAPRVKSIDMIEPSIDLRAIAARLCQDRNNVVIHTYKGVDDLPLLLKDRKFDLIIVNSVLQYSSHEEIRTLFQYFQLSIQKNGALFVSDIVPKGTMFIQELYYVAKFFCKRRGFWLGVGAFMRYVFNQLKLVREMATLTMTTFTRQSFQNLAEEYFHVRWEKNPAITKNRYAALLTPKGNVSS